MMNPGMVPHTYNSRIWVGEEGICELIGQPRLHNEFQDSSDYIERRCLNIHTYIHHTHTHINIYVIFCDIIQFQKDKRTSAICSISSAVSNSKSLDVTM